MNYFIHESTIIDEDVFIGDGSKIWHFTHIMNGASIGENCVIGQNVYIGEDVVIGNGVKIQNNVSVYKGVTIENDVFIGPSAVFTNILYPRAFIERKSEFIDTIVKEGASIGANSTIICGVTIGKYAMIGAGCVVTRDVPNHALMIGNPATMRGKVRRDGSPQKQ